MHSYFEVLDKFKLTNTVKICIAIYYSIQNNVIISIPNNSLLYLGNLTVHRVLLISGLLMNPKKQHMKNICFSSLVPQR